ncbi:MAG TPA: methyl-accepting chemotaxis protein [Oleiagrimonas sp.]|nr:methyl-accepting chemotaxis protein [Oleiagrimonas sp.]
MHDLSINTIVAGALGVCAVMMLVIVGLHISTTNAAGQSFQSITRLQQSQVAPARRTLNRINGARFIMDTASYYIDVKPEKLDVAALKTVPGLIDQAHAGVKRFRQGFATVKDKKLVKQLAARFDAELDLLARQMAALKQRDTEAFNALRNRADTTGSAMAESFKTFAARAGTRGEALVAKHEHQTGVAFYAVMAALVVALLLLAAVFVALRRLVVAPLVVAGKELERIAGADLSHTLHIRGRNEIGKLFDSMRHMQASLGRIVGQARKSSNSIHVGSREIARGNADLSSRTEEQAASLEETATSMEEITATVRQNADNARQASRLAKDASTTASRGGQVMERVTVTMRGISDSSSKVAEIIGMIDSIAFQTNILALNASVEAARAGEQGRGFAVVAGEVRNLAGRSADAAREIKQLIDSSGEQVSDGSSQVEQASETMREVVSSVQRVTDIMDEISAASQEQSTGIEQVSRAVSQMDEVTQQNAALVEQTSAAAVSLEAQAARLDSAMAVFRMRESVGKKAGDAGVVDSTRNEASARPQASPAPPAHAPRRSETDAAGADAAQPALATATEDWEAF